MKNAHPDKRVFCTHHKVHLGANPTVVDLVILDMRMRAYGTSESVRNFADALTLVIERDDEPLVAWYLRNAAHLIDQRYHNVSDKEADSAYSCEINGDCTSVYDLAGVDPLDWAYDGIDTSSNLRFTDGEHTFTVDLGEAPEEEA